MHSTCKSQNVPVDKIFQEKILTDDAVLDGIALEVDVIEMDRKDIFIEDIQIIWPNPGAESFVIVGVSSDIFLMKVNKIFLILAIESA